MSTRDNRLRVGAILILIGALALVQNLNLLPVDSSHLVGLTFLLGGAAVFLSGRKDHNAFKFYSGVAAMFVGFAIIVGTTDILPGQIIGTVCLWIIASLFLRVYLNKREAYWPIIPAGILLTVGLAVGLEGFRLIHGQTIGALINLGIAGTFGYLYNIRNVQNKLEWAKYPAAAMMVVSLIVYFSERHYGFGPLIFASVLILAGIGLIIQTLRAGRHAIANDQTP